MDSISVIILAAGFGTRMKSKKPKVVHEICGKPLVLNVVDAVKNICNKPAVVVGHGSEHVYKALKNRDVDYATQEEVLGTGHAVMSAKAYIPNEGQVLVLYGDTPLITEDTLNSFLEFHKNESQKVSVMTMLFEDPAGYGRIIRDDNDNFLRIVEHKDASVDERGIKEVNSGICVFDAVYLKEALSLLKNDNTQNEYYLTDAIEIIRNKCGKAGAFIVHDNDELMGINNRVQLNLAETYLKNRIMEAHMLNGVTIIDKYATVIGPDVTIGMDTTILPGTILMGQTVIGDDCLIGPSARITNATIADGVEVKDSTILESKVANNTKIGPYAYLRPNSNVGANCKVGDFVEIKNSNIGNGTKISHLAYVGDGDVGENCNISCGVIFTNYDGKNKFRTVVKDDAFVGCNVNLVAPVTVEKGAYIAAGSTITSDVPENTLAIARARQTNKPGWQKK